MAGGGFVLWPSLALWLGRNGAADKAGVSMLGVTMAKEESACRATRSAHQRNATANRHTRRCFWSKRVSFAWIAQAVPFNVGFGVVETEQDGIVSNFGPARCVASKQILMPVGEGRRAGEPEHTPFHAPLA